MSLNKWICSRYWPSLPRVDQKNWDTKISISPMVMICVVDGTYFLNFKAIFLMLLNRLTNPFFYNRIAKVVKFFLILFLITSCTSTSPKGLGRANASLATSDSYCGCLLFVDDFRTQNDLDLVHSYSPNTLIRSWYRWGEPPAAKSYRSRKNIVSKLQSHGVDLGGGTSLSIVSESDYMNPKFSRDWVSIGLNGEEIKRSEYLLGTLSSPGFRAYLIEKLIEQVKLGTQELHLGETNGAIFFDRWTRQDFSLWVKNKYASKNLDWWIRHFGALGKSFFNEVSPSIKEIGLLEGRYKENFWLEWGIPGSWKGLNKEGKTAFLYYAYGKNLNSFISELRSSLEAKGLRASIDVWGFADWISTLRNKPDAIFSSPPDQRWGFNWELEEDFDLLSVKDSIVTILKNELNKLHPILFVMMIDHPKPFYDLSKFSDTRQQQLHQFFAEIAEEVGANFVVRSYSHKPDRLGPATKDWLRAFCKRQNDRNFCPINTAN